MYGYMMASAVCREHATSDRGTRANDATHAACRDAVNGSMAPMPFTASYDFDNFTTFEDPFSYPARPYEEVVPDSEVINETTTPEQLDHKLLGFSAPILKASLIDDSGQFAEISMTAELYGMFFVAEDVFAGENTGRPLELTCYRRNLWQCSGQVSVSRPVSQVINEQGTGEPITELVASITAIESIDGKPTEIILIPWKSAPEDSKIAGAPPNVPLDMGSLLDAETGAPVGLPISWKRLQFKHATANNGRRKGLQQHYVVQINLLAKLNSGEFIKVAEVQSGPVIVRGRSPRNFDSRRDVPLMGDKKMERRGTNASSSDASVKAEKESLVQTLKRYHPLGNPRAEDWPQPYTIPNQGPHPAKKLATSPNLQRPPIPAWSTDAPARNSGAGATPARHSVSTAQRNNSLRPASSVPLSLSLSEDERSPGRGSTETASPQQPKPSGKNAQNPTQTPMEEVDMLYEYFPLSVDDW